MSLYFGSSTRSGLLADCRTTLRKSGGLRLGGEGQRVKRGHHIKGMARSSAIPDYSRIFLEGGGILVAFSLTVNYNVS